MDLIQEAFTQLYPNRQYSYTSQINYSRKFKPYNARVKWTSRHLQFNFSQEWKNVDKDIVIGLIQSLLLRISKEKKSTFNLNLYHIFVRRLPETAQRKESDPKLQEAFQQINREYFYNTLEQPTIIWGTNSTTTLAHYDLHTDRIVMSTIFQNSPVQLRNYILYHEMLHKKHRFKQFGNRSHFHTPEFKKDELRFENAKTLERDLEKFLNEHRGKKRITRLFARFF
jgi:hypothetical protein